MDSPVGEVRIARILLDSLDVLIKAKRLHLHGYIIMENHVHLVASGQNLAKQIGAFKSFTARSIVDLLEDEGRVQILRQWSWHRKRHKTGQTYQVWQEGSHPEMMQNEEMLNRKLNYIHFNPVRKGYVDDPAHCDIPATEIIMAGLDCCRCISWAKIQKRQSRDIRTPSETPGARNVLSAALISMIPG